MKARDLLAGVLVVAATIALLCDRTAAQNAVPMLINYQGELRSPSTGEPVPDGSYEMLFRIYDLELGGAPLWEGTYSSLNGNPVQVTRGILSVILGSGTGNELSSSIFNGADRWLEIRVGAETLSPRQRITSVSYSLVSENSRLLGGKQASEFAGSTHPHLGSDITSGTVAEARIDPLITRDTEKDAAITAHAAISNAHHARYTDVEAVAAMGAKADTNPLNHDKTTSLAWTSITSVPAGFADGIDNDSGGDITGVTAGAGLTGGGASGDVALSAVFGGTGAAPTLARSDHNHDATYWTLTGNTGTSGTNFLGTTDSQPLDLRVNSVRALRLEPNATSTNIIAGYAGNAVTAGAVGATIAGGGLSINTNLVTDDYGTVGGGGGNQAGDSAGGTANKRYATVAGGLQNTASGVFATVGGGGGNTASGSNATVGGGTQNTASGDYAAVGGGTQNTASGQFATVGGGRWNTAGGDDSFAAGRKAKAVHVGAFAWADSNDLDFSSTANNEFSARCTGGARFVSAIDGSGSPTAGVSLAAGGGSWSSISDRTLKDNFSPASAREVLAKLVAVPITVWNYKAQDYSMPHMGPMAQDFYAAFALGEDDKHISTVDADGVALAAIQGLHEMLREKDAEITAIKKQNANLQERLSALEKLFERLSEER